MRLAIGLDFGTTNSSVAAIVADGEVKLAQFSTADGSTPSFRSLLYFERDAKKQTHSYSGPSAIEHYLAGTDQQRRLVQSLKSYLPSKTLTGTEVFGRRYALEDLLARMLRDLRTGAESAFGFPIERAVVGRPVRFVGAESEEDDAYAVARLGEACRRAGFTEVEFEYEPVGAAYAYESTLDHDELVLIGDFGGGTSDFSLLRLGPGMQARKRVLGTTGVGLAGDAFDAKLVRHLVSRRSAQRRLSAPAVSFSLRCRPGFMRNLERWHYLSFLRTRNVTQILKGAQVRALEPEKIEALQTLIEEDLGFQLHGAVQRLKYQLSRAEQAEFHFNEGGLNLRIPITRAEFEGWIADELASITGAVDELLNQTGIAAAQVDRVFLTGGTSFVPAVERIFTERFPAERVQRGEAFTAVAHGLALRAQQLFSI